MTTFEVRDVHVQAAIIRAAAQVAVSTHGATSTPAKVALLARELAEQLASPPDAERK